MSSGRTTAADPLARLDPSKGESAANAVALAWGLFVAVDALKVYFDRPTTEAEIDRQVRRLQ